MQFNERFWIWILITSTEYYNSNRHIRYASHPVQVETICGIVCYSGELWKTQVSIVPFCSLAHENKQKRLYLVNTFSPKLDIHEKVSFDVRKTRKLPMAISMKIYIVGTSFVRRHLMECNSRWNEHMTQKMANLMGENTTFYI